MKIVIIDYGMGNLKSLKGALQQIGIEDIDITKILNAFNSDKLILLVWGIQIGHGKH